MLGRACPAGGRHSQTYPQVIMRAAASGIGADAREADNRKMSGIPSAFLAERPENNSGGGSGGLCRLRWFSGGFGRFCWLFVRSGKTASEMQKALISKDFLLVGARGFEPP